MLVWNDFVVTFARSQALGSRLRWIRRRKPTDSSISDLEFVAEWLIVEENPGVLILVIPVVFQLLHTLHESL